MQILVKRPLDAGSAFHIKINAEIHEKMMVVYYSFDTIYEQSSEMVWSVKMDTPMDNTEKIQRYEVAKWI